MSLSSRKLYYRRGTTTYSIDLYTTDSEDGMGSNPLRIRSQDGATLYAPTDTSSTPKRDSYLRIYYGGATRIIKSTLLYYYASWTQFGSRTRNGNTSYNVTVDRYTVYSSSQVTNIRIAYDNSGLDQWLTPYCYIDGVKQNGVAGQDSYFRLSSGSHTIVLYGTSGTYGPPDDTFTAGFYSVGYYIVP